MKTICLCLVFLCALPVFGEGARTPTNFLANIYHWGDKSTEVPPGTVAMQPFNVSATKIESDAVSKEMDQLFGYHPADDEGEGGLANRSLPSFSQNEPVLDDIVDSLTVLSRDIALKYRGGVKISPRVTLFFKGGLFWKVNDKYSIGLVVRITW